MVSGNFSFQVIMLQHWSSWRNGDASDRLVFWKEIRNSLNVIIYSAHIGLNLKLYFDAVLGYEVNGQ